MKKTLIALALSTVPLAALADVTLYGEIKGGLEYSARSHLNNTVTNVNDWGSYLGFKGEEDLGNGLKAIWQIEQSVSLDTDSYRNIGWANRDSFIGLSGDFGTLRVGYLSDSFRKGLKTIDEDWEGNGVRTLAHLSQFDKRYTGVRYDSPEWSGFKFNVFYSPEDNQRFNEARLSDPDYVADSLSTNNDGFSGMIGSLNYNTGYRDILSVGLGYENAGWFAKYAYKNLKRNAPSFSYEEGKEAKPLNGEVHGVEFGYNDGTIFAGVGYRNSRNIVAGGNGFYASNWQTNDAAVTFAYTAGNIVPRISLAYGEEKERHVANPTKNKYSQLIAGVDYNLSKRTTVLASLGYWTNKPKTWVEVRDQTTDVFRKEEDKRYQRRKDRLEDYSIGLGIRHKF
ncbi:MAG: porin [Neisseriaceae bacterium]